MTAPDHRRHITDHNGTTRYRRCLFHGCRECSGFDGLQTVRDDGLVVIMHELTPIARQGLMNGEVDGSHFPARWASRPERGPCFALNM